MPNQKISELTTIVTVDNAVDLFPIVDTSANTTKKITPTALKSALALDNVNNTSDANKPVSTAQQDALNAKVTANAAITAGTAPKVTFDAKGLVTSGDSLDETDLPTGINANKIGTGVVSTTEFEYLNGVTSAIQTQIDAKQATLVSGTNIKTINGATVLGSGDIVIGATPSGVAGAIQFSDGSAFASDAANFFWDDANDRLGVGINTPSARLHVKGSGSTAATDALIVQNSAGTSLFSLRDDGVAAFSSAVSGGSFAGNIKTDFINTSNNFYTVLQINTANGNGKFYQFVSIGTSSDPVASAALDVVSTTKGFLPPRMTTTQKNAISSPASGLMVYDSTTNKLCCYNGSTWNDLF